VKPLRALLAGWVFGGLGAGVGSVLGRAFGHKGLFIGAVAGGILSIALVARVLIKIAWLPAASYRGALAGGLVGFAVAIPIAVTNLRTPIIPLASCALIGVGLLFGAGTVAGSRAAAQANPRPK
jgi:Na+-transporting NADH:ubiquinone oxidoreductase subunit NqrB